MNKTNCIYKKLCNGFSENTAENITAIIDAIGRGDINQGLEQTALMCAITATEKGEYANIITAYHRPRKKRELSENTKQRNAQRKLQAIKEQYNLTDEILAEMVKRFKNA